MVVRLVCPGVLVLKALERGALRARELERVTGLPRSTLYRALKDLLLAGMVEQRKRGDAVYYEITGEGRKALAEARRLLLDDEPEAKADGLAVGVVA